MQTNYDKLANQLKQPGDVRDFLEHEAMYSVNSMQGLFDAIKALSTDATICRLAHHGAVMSEILHNDIDVARATIADSIEAAKGAAA